MGDSQNSRPTCFVIMGFGKRTDYATGRTLDLDKSYRNLIKPAVEEAGFSCMRADEIVHTGLIDVPMFERLASSDLVVADLSTSNGNVFYELGIRHALRPQGTIVIAEDSLMVPFDTAHTVVRRYKHLGEDISYDEVLRFRKELTNAIKEVYAHAGTDKDSPVYNLLSDLLPPSLGRLYAAEKASPAQAGAPADPTLATLLEQAEHKFKTSDFRAALALFGAAAALSPNNQSITQRRVLVRFKSQLPDPVTALSEARKLLESLSPKTSADPQTVSLLGDIELSLFEAGQGVHHLLNARQAFDRLYATNPDWRRGITLAYLVTQQSVRQQDPDERMADSVIARRLWREVIELGKNRLTEINALRQVERFLPESPDPAERALEEAHILCAVAEAYFGLGEFEKYENERSRIAWAPDGQETLEGLDSRVQALGLLLRRENADDPANIGGGQDPATARAFVPSSARRAAASAGTPQRDAELKAADAAGAAPPAARTEVFISYAWGDESEALADELDKELQSRRVFIVRDKRDLKFKGRIKEFMERIGRGKCVILVISKKYLQSPNCWYELLRVAENGQFYERVFPVVLPSAGIYEPVERLRYVQYWEQKQKELDEALKSVSAANLHGFREEIDLYTEIRERLPKLTDVLKDMNTLTPETHRESNFEELYTAVMEKLAS